jgi:fumarylacetoacetate (FAA) hydrolase
MKLGSLKSGRDGALVVVNRELSMMVEVPSIAKTMQEALDSWRAISVRLREVYDELNLGKVKDAVSYDSQKMASPLPRAYQWLDGSAYVNHVELVRKARGAEMPPSFWTDPLMYQGCSDSFMGPSDPIRLESEAWGIDFESEVCVITDDVPMGIRAAEAESHIQLVLLANDVSLRNLIPAELAKGLGFVQSKPSTAFSPVAVTPDELGDAWKENKVHLEIITHLNGNLFGSPNAGIDMTFDFAQLVAHAAKSRMLCAGSIIGGGTVSNLDRSKGSSCIAEKRTLETIASGKATTPFMKFGDRVRIEMLDSRKRSIFGSIEQIVQKYEP